MKKTCKVGILTLFALFVGLTLASSTVAKKKDFAEEDTPLFI